MILYHSYQSTRTSSFHLARNGAVSGKFNTFDI